MAADSYELIDYELSDSDLSDSELSDSENDIIHHLNEKNKNISRKIELSEYYKERNKSYIRVIQRISTILLVYILIIILYKKNNNTIYPIIIYSILFLTTIVGSILLLMDILTIIYRDNMDFNKYIWPFWFPEGRGNNIGLGINSNVSLSDLTPDICFGASCCDSSTTWDSNIGKCI